MIPSYAKFDLTGVVQFTDNMDYCIRTGSAVRVRLMGTRHEVGQMWAVGTIDEDFLGYEHIHPAMG